MSRGRPEPTATAPPATVRIAGTTAIVALVVFACSTLVAVARGTAFGFDEAVYVQLAGRWVDGTPASGWDLHRPPGLSILAVLPLGAGIEAEWAVRLFGVAAGTAVLVVAGRLAGDAGGSTATAIAVVALAAAAPLQVEASSFLTDVPATAALLAAAALAWRWGATEGEARVLPWAAAALATAFYLRYGAVVGVAAIVAGVAIVFGPVARRRWRDAAVAMALLILLLTPHLVLAMLATGVPWGIVALARSAADDGTLPALEYLGWFPWRLLGPVAAFVAFAGVVGIARAGFRTGRRRSSGDRLLRFIGLVVVPQALVLGFFVHGEPRYALAPMAFLVVAGATALGEGSTGWRRRPRLRPGTIAALAMGALLLGVVLAQAEIGRRDAAYGWTREVAVAIRADASGAPCSVLTSDVPIVSRYSGCEAFTLVGGPPAERLELLTGARQYLVERADGLHVPPPAALAALREGAAPWRSFTDGTGTEVATVYRLPDP